MGPRLKPFRPWKSIATANASASAQIGSYAGSSRRTSGWAPPGKMLTAPRLATRRSSVTAASTSSNGSRALSLRRRGLAGRNRRANRCKLAPAPSLHPQAPSANPAPPPSERAPPPRCPRRPSPATARPRQWTSRPGQVGLEHGGALLPDRVKRRALAPAAASETPGRSRSSGQAGRDTAARRTHPRASAVPPDACRYPSSAGARRPLGLSFVPRLSNCSEW